MLEAKEFGLPPKSWLVVGLPWIMPTWKEQERKKQVYLSQMVQSTGKVKQVTTNRRLGGWLMWRDDTLAELTKPTNSPWNSQQRTRNPERNQHRRICISVPCTHYGLYWIAEVKVARHLPAWADMWHFPVYMVRGLICQSVVKSLYFFLFFFFFFSPTDTSRPRQNVSLLRQLRYPRRWIGKLRCSQKCCWSGSSRDLSCWSDG